MNTIKQPFNTLEILYKKGIGVVGCQVNLEIEDLSFELQLWTDDDIYVAKLSLYVDNIVSATKKGKTSSCRSGMQIANYPKLDWSLYLIVLPTLISLCSASIIILF